MIEIIAQYFMYAMAVGIPSLFVLRWLYRQWWKANLPAIWAWGLQQRRRDKTIRVNRERIEELAKRLARLETDMTQVLGDVVGDETENLMDVVKRLNNVERMIAQLRHRLRSKGIMIDG